MGDTVTRVLFQNDKENEEAKLETVANTCYNHTLVIREEIELFIEFLHEIFQLIFRSDFFYGTTTDLKS